MGFHIEAYCPRAFGRIAKPPTMIPPMKKRIVVVEIDAELLSELKFS